MNSNIPNRTSIRFFPLQLANKDDTEKNAKKHPPSPKPKSGHIIGAGSRPIGMGSRPIGGGSRPIGMGSNILCVKQVGLGYIPDLPDFRDHALRKEQKRIKSNNLLKKRKSKCCENEADHLEYILGESSKEPGLPERYSLGDRYAFSIIEDQEHYNSCTANAVIGLIEFLILKDGGQLLDLSRFFLYGVTRRLLGITSDSGAYIRTTIKSMRLFGVPPEAEWPYQEEYLNREPEAFHYAFAQNFRSISYVRLDGYGQVEAGISRGENTLNLLKHTVRSGFPVAFGFSVYESIGQMTDDFVIPLPRPNDKMVGGHAVLCIGFDDSISIKDYSGKEISKGAIIVRNSWGVEWGDHGYGYLPYEYITEELAQDFWTILHEDFAPLGDFN